MPTVFSSTIGRTPSLASNLKKISEAAHRAAELVRNAPKPNWIHRRHKFPCSGGLVTVPEIRRSQTVIKVFIGELCWLK